MSTMEISNGVQRVTRYSAGPFAPLLGQHALVDHVANRDIADEAVDNVLPEVGHSRRGRSG
jgi:hypothetical protein